MGARADICLQRVRHSKGAGIDSTVGRTGLGSFTPKDRTGGLGRSTGSGSNPRQRLPSEWTALDPRLASGIIAAAVPGYSGGGRAGLSPASQGRGRKAHVPPKHKLCICSITKGEGLSRRQKGGVQIPEETDKDATSRAVAGASDGRDRHRRGCAGFSLWPRRRRALEPGINASCVAFILTDFGASPKRFDTPALKLRGALRTAALTPLPRGWVFASHACRFRGTVDRPEGQITRVL